MKYTFELHNDIKSLHRMQAFLEELWHILRIQNTDSEEGINGGASIHYNIKIEVKEEWI